jgi:hypothetical protein
MRDDRAAGAAGLQLMLERFRAKACAGLDPGVDIGSREENGQMKKWSLRSDSIATEKVLYSAAMVREL